MHIYITSHDSDALSYTIMIVMYMLVMYMLVMYMVYDLVIRYN